MSKEAITIQSPDLGRAEELLALRATLYEEELIISGATPEVARHHVAPWRQPATTQGFSERLEEWMDHGDHILRSVSLNDELVGYFHGEIRPSSVIAGEEKYLASIQLASQVRRQGIGRRLIRELEVFAPYPDDAEYPITLEVLAGNTGAISFYTALGFKRSIDITSNVPHLKAFEMRKDVNAGGIA